ncbi:tyrosine-type recombinase/integrase [Mesorhizobium sp. A623]
MEIVEQNRTLEGNPMKNEIANPKAPAKGLNPKFIEGLKPNPDGRMYEVADTGETSGLRIRVAPRSKIFYVSARWRKGATSATSRMIGKFAESEDKIPGPGYATLAQARDKVREWEAVRKSGIDPREREREQREIEERTAQAAAAEEKRDFKALAEAYVASSPFRKNRQSKRVERSIRYDLLTSTRNPWMNKNVSEIDDQDVAAVIANIRDRGAPTQAWHILSYAKLIFSYGMMPENRKLYALKAHPIAHLKLKDLSLTKNVRKVVPDDDETVALWRAADALGYPYGSLFRLLIATGQRKSDIGESSWPELDLAEKLLTIPAERFKSELQHLVPLSDISTEIFSALPRFKEEGSGLFLFSTSNGVKAVNGYSKAKRRLDEYTLIELRKIKAARGENPARVSLRKFTLHDKRRIVRSNLSKLKVPEHIAELVIGHGKKGLARIYDQYQYLDEMREALQAWADRLRMLLNTTPG